jgi:hypothetical protein
MWTLSNDYIVGGVLLYYFYLHSNFARFVTLRGQYQYVKQNAGLTFRRRSCQLPEKK